MYIVNMKTMKELMNTFAHTGSVEWISIRPEKGAQPVERSSITVDKNQGIVGDHYHGKSGKRHVTLIQKEHIDSVGSIIGRKVHPSELRRNIVISGINLLSLKDQYVKIGD